MMNEPTFKEVLTGLVKETKQAEDNLPEGVTVAKNIFDYEDIEGYQVRIIIGRDIFDEEEGEEGLGL